MLYKWTSGALTVLVVAIGASVAFVGWHTIDDIKRQAQSATNKEISNIQEQSRKTLNKQTTEIQRQITTRLNDEFQSESIRRTVEAAAKQQTSRALLPIITKEARSQVTAGVKVRTTKRAASFDRRGASFCRRA